MSDVTSTTSPRSMKLAFIIKALIVLTLTACFWLYVGDRYTFGIDAQKERCLPYRYFLIDRWQRPQASELAVGDMISVHLTAAQRPANARWSVETQMVKRAVASVPGTIVHVRRTGITFDLDGKTWNHGTALETASRLGHKVEDYERDYVLAPGQFFFMGDNPHTYDSRYYGPLTENMIVGRVVWAW